MEKLSTLGEIIIAPSNFSSEIEVNLDGTDEDDLFDDRESDGKHGRPTTS